MNERRLAGTRTALLGVLVSLAASPAWAIFWNNDPAFGVASSTGLTDRVDWFQNVHQINNQSNNTLGTATLLNNEWLITVRHVVQNGGNYGQIAPPGSVYLNVGGVRYYADEIFTPDGGSEMALVRLRSGVAGALDATGIINYDFNETGRIVHIGGYGYRGYINTTNAGGSQPGTVEGLGSFRRAYNINYIPGQIRIIADGEDLLEANGLLEGTVGSGDSGGPMFGYYGSARNGGLSNPNNWKLIGLTATGSGGSGGESWWGQSNYTRVSAYGGFIQSTLAAADNAGPSTTGPWTVDSGTGFWDSAGDRITFTGSSAAPVAHASFGDGGAGYTLESVGDAIRMTALLDTDQDMAATQFRYGLFDDEGGTIDGTVSGGEAWNGYYIANAVGRARTGAYEKGENGGGVGAWWSGLGANSSVLVPESATAGTGDYLLSSTGVIPAGRYEIELSYTRVGDGLQIDWDMTSIDDAGVPDGVYEHTGSIIDETPASTSWNYNQAGLFLLGSGFQGSIIADDINVEFIAGPLAGDYNADGLIDAADYTLWRDGDPAADGDGDGTVDADDYALWANNYGAGDSSPTAAVPEPAALLLAALGLPFARRR